MSFTSAEAPSPTRATSTMPPGCRASRTSRSTSRPPRAEPTSSTSAHFTARASTAGFTLTATLPTFQVTSIGLTSGGNTGRVTVPIVGALFSTNTQASLVAGSTVIPAASVYFQDASHVFATFDLTGRRDGDLRPPAPGRRPVRHAPGLPSRSSPARPAAVQISLSVPSVVRAGGSDGVVVAVRQHGEHRRAGAADRHLGRPRPVLLAR